MQSIICPSWCHINKDYINNKLLNYKYISFVDYEFLCNSHFPEYNSIIMKLCQIKIIDVLRVTTKIVSK